MTRRSSLWGKSSEASRRRSAARAPRTQCCWSLEVSLATSVFVAATTTHLICRNGPRDRGNAVFLGVFGSMQLIDALLWWEQGGGMGLEACSTLNRVVTRAGIGIILLEPIAALIGTSMIAKKKPSLLEVMSYAALFLLTPLAGTTYAPGLPTPVPCHAVVEGACDASHFPKQWGNLLFDLRAPCVCSSVTPQGHMRYGGLDVLYHSLHTPLDEVRSCAVDNPAGPAVVRGSEEIPMVLRLAFLLSMAVPYATKVKPASCGLSHAAILLATWVYGATSDAHASLWCVANVVQGALMLADPLLWPSTEYGPSGEESPAAVPPDAAAASWRPASSSAPSHARISTNAKPRALSVTEPPEERGGDQPASMLNSSSSSASGGSSPTPPGNPVPGGKTKRQPFYRRSRVPDQLDAIVIGSGIGGLACAALMAKAGKRVLVLEQHYRPGGCTHAFTEVGENAFDSGIHYVGGGPIMTGLLEHVVAEPIELAQMGSRQDGYLYDRFDLGGGPDDMVDFRAGRDVLVEDLVARYPHEEAGIRAYMAAVRRSQVGTNALMASKFVPPRMPGGAALSRALAGVAQRYGRRTASEVVAEYVADPELRALLSGGQLIDWNLAPDKVSWLVSAGMMNYYADGGFYPGGGSNTIPERIIPVIEAAGGAVLCKAPVAELLVDAGTGRCAGVRMANGDELAAPAVVSGAGYHTTFERLLPREALARAGLELSAGPSSTMAPSHGHVCAFISLDGPPGEFGLQPWNIHSMPELPRYGHDIARMQEEFYADPLGAQRECLMTLTCPSAKDPLYGQQFPGR
eukprot:jgi/Tetstr1/445907/TSEL_033536.t1